MAAVFLSYRRIDVGLPLAGRVFDSLTQILGPDTVFLDSALRIGADWPAEIESAIHECGVLLPLIGPNWLAPGLFENSNWTRREISVALERKIHILPIYIDGGGPPTPEKLPPDIARLSERQGFYIDSRSDAVFHASLDAVARAILPILGITSSETTTHTCEVILVREPPKPNWAAYEWRLFIDGHLAVTLDFNDVFKSTRISSGVHTLTISWRWEASYVRAPQGATTPSYSSGTSLPLTTDFVAGRYHFTLRALDQGFWKALFGGEAERIIVDASPMGFSTR